jgi:hypothetical protein
VQPARRSVVSLDSDQTTLDKNIETDENSSNSNTTLLSPTFKLPLFFRNQTSKMDLKKKKKGNMSN